MHDMVARLAQISWERHGHRAWSKAALLKEYFRRAARWSTALACTPRTPFFDIAACVDPAIRADPAAIDQLTQIANQGGANWGVAHVLPFIVHWSALRATPGIVLPGLKDPFEPLILLFERDGGYHMEQGGVNLEWMTMRVSGWRDRAADQPMASFDPQLLDQIDQAGSMEQFGHPPKPL
jgi:hypothetical protein